MHVYLIATMDTKGEEAVFVAEQLRQQGLKVLLVDTGSSQDPGVAVDVTAKEVFSFAEKSLDQIRQANDRGLAVTQAAIGVANLVEERFQQGDVAGLIGLGGSAGTTIGTAAMRRLPLGVPKLMVSTLASGQVRPYVGDKDILMMNAVVDVAGLNRISRTVFTNAAAAMVGMINRRQSADPGSAEDRPLIAASMFGVTTPCVQHAREILEAEGYEVLVFHATGNGGQAMESLIRDGVIVGVLDITTTELADEIVGGVLSAGPDRLTAAAEKGIPQVVSVGATDMVNFGPRDSVPAEFAERLFYQHNATVTLMRTTADENRLIGNEIAAKLSRSTGPACLMLPLQGVSAIDGEGQPFDDPHARQMLFEPIRDGRLQADGSVEVCELDQHINDSQFAEAAARKLLAMIAATSPS